MSGLDDFSEKSKRAYFNALVSTQTPECSGEVCAGEIICYKIACDDPAMLSYMPDLVQKRSRSYYSDHMKNCDICSGLFVVTEIE